MNDLLQLLGLWWVQAFSNDPIHGIDEPHITPSLGHKGMKSIKVWPFPLDGNNFKGSLHLQSIWWEWMGWLVNLLLMQGGTKVSLQLYLENNTI